jgi:hypothetical protein
VATVVLEQVTVEPMQMVAPEQQIAAAEAVAAVKITAEHLEPVVMVVLE